MDIEKIAKLSKTKIINTYNKKQKYWYVYSDQSYWNPEKKQTRHIRRTIGKRLTKDGDMVHLFKQRNMIILLVLLFLVFL
ncbi:MAG: hypothetical protein PF693_01245 [Spirochaetia bacterium]|jgi:hypothetical protein|nr:hypothetical protein [Spirochaetia bacterium]